MSSDVKSSGIIQAPRRHVFSNKKVSRKDFIGMGSEVGVEEAVGMMMCGMVGDTTPTQGSKRQRLRLTS